jgi:hypothetical protein
MVYDILQQFNKESTSNQIMQLNKIREWRNCFEALKISLFQTKLLWTFQISRFTTLYESSNQNVLLLSFIIIFFAKMNTTNLV